MGIIASSGQIIFVVASGYYASFVSARQAMVPNASISASEASGDSVIQQAPYSVSENVQVNCSKDSSDTVCSATGIATLAFPVVGIDGMRPTTSFPVHVSMTLPTQNS